MIPKRKVFFESRSMRCPQYAKDLEHRPNPSIGRMYFVSPKAGEKYYLRLLLCHVAGATSFEDLRTHAGITYASNKEACIARGFLEDDKEWDRCLWEVKDTAMPFQLRSLFAIILEYNHPEKPGDLWAKYLPSMMEDKVCQLRELGLPCDEAALARCANAALWDVEQLLRVQGLSMKDFAGMPIPLRPSGPEHMSEFRRAEVTYDRDALQEAADRDLRRCTEEQRTIVDECMRFLAQPAATKKMMFIDSPAGGGKTFLMNLILGMLRGRGDIALACASTGIASMLLAGGTTAHSRFGIPVPVNEESVSSVRVTSERANIIADATVIIWDEITMADKHAVECADRLCREAMALKDPELENVPFGGKVIIFAGDWRQLLPVVPRGGRAQVVNASMKRSTLWNQSFSKNNAIYIEWGLFSWNRTCWSKSLFSIIFGFQQDKKMGFCQKI
jgi:hypothetical protein